MEFRWMRGWLKWKVPYLTILMEQLVGKSLNKESDGV